MPANFGELTPVKRWTTRFGLAITFKAKDFSGLGSSDTPAVKTEEGGGSKPKPASGDDSNAALRNMSTTDIARNFLRSPLDNTSPQSPVETRPAASERHRNVAVESDIADVRYVNPRESANNTYFISRSESRTPLIQISSLIASQSGDDRISINAAAGILDYSMYFKAGRFYLVIPHARLNVIEDGLQGRVFSQAMIEKRGDDFVLSFVWAPGTKASVAERPNGLDLLFVSASN